MQSLNELNFLMHLSLMANMSWSSKKGENWVQTFGIEETAASLPLLAILPPEF